jgi:hypothetical protein
LPALQPSFLIITIRNNYQHSYTSGKDPMGLAALALYIACANNGEKMSQREIANAGWDDGRHDKKQTKGA